MTTLPAKWAGTIAAFAGAGGWLAIGALTHQREAWDSGVYFSWYLPSLAIGLCGLGFFAPARAWRWGLLPFAAQAIVATVQNPGADLLPLGLLVFGFYGVLCIVPALLGAAGRRWVDRRGASGV